MSPPVKIKTHPKVTYGSWLREQMAARGFTQRSLARALNPDDPETARRAVRRYLDDRMTPREPARVAIAAALGSE